jgi:hypothetical protein
MWDITPGVRNQGELQRISKEMINIKGKINIWVKILNSLTVVENDTILESVNLGDLAKWNTVTLNDDQDMYYNEAHKKEWISTMKLSNNNLSSMKEQ